MTVLDGEGWYTKHDVKILMVYCRKIESVTIFRIVKSVDEHAFVTQGAVNGVYGQGFDKVKIKMKKVKQTAATDSRIHTAISDRNAADAVRRSNHEE